MEKIKLENVSKKFKLSFQAREGFLYRVLEMLGKKDKQREVFWGIKNISLSVGSGEIVGVIGRNGSGKSTLLRVIAGVYQKNGGEITTLGESIYINGVSHGLRSKLTMRENIFLIGAVLGLSQKNTAKIFDQVVEFSDLKDYLDVKLVKFSSGMIIRLAYSITIHSILNREAEIILLDEVFSTSGDIFFQEKSLGKIAELQSKQKAIIIASHDLNLIENYCQRVIWLEGGKIIKQGEPHEVIKSYQKFYQENENKLIVGS